MTLHDGTDTEEVEVRPLSRIPHGVRHTLLRWQFWAGLTLGFPLEHFLWEKLWPFTLVTKWLGL